MSSIDRVAKTNTGRIPGAVRREEVGGRCDAEAVLQERRSDSGLARRQLVCAIFGRIPAATVNGTRF